MEPFRLCLSRRHDDDGLVSGKARPWMNATEEGALMEAFKDRHSRATRDDGPDSGIERPWTTTIE